LIFDFSEALDACGYAIENALELSILLKQKPS